MQEALRLIREYDMLPPGERILCAVSGGGDSMCLLHFLQDLSKREGFSLAAAHFNHHLRGAASDGDEALVRNYCLPVNGIPAYFGGAEVGAEAAKRKRGVEETARKLRYAFLERTAREQGASRIATAHTADDNLETILFHLRSGAAA